MTAPEIQQEIERTRDHLGETVEELAARADVKARARARAAGMKDKAAQIKVRAQGKATEMSGQLRQSQLVQGDTVRRRWLLAAAAAGVVLVGSVLVRRRRRRRA
jgi:predicted transcriptional regulator